MSSTSGYEGSKKSSKKMQKYIFGAVVIAVVVLIIYSATSKEGFSPTETMRWQHVEPGLGVERMSGRANSYFAQSQGLSYVPRVDPNDPRPANEQILTSSAFNCAKRTNSDNDAWGWMGKNVSGSEGMAPRNDSDMTKILAGY